MKQEDWKRLYTKLNDAGEGFDAVSGDQNKTVDDAVEVYVSSGWTLVCERSTREDVTVIRHPTGKTLRIIGGDAEGNGAWAVDVHAWAVEGYRIEVRGVWAGASHATWVPAVAGTLNQTSASDEEASTFSTFEGAEAFLLEHIESERRGDAQTFRIVPVTP